MDSSKRRGDFLSSAVLAAFTVYSVYSTIDLMLLHFLLLNEVLFVTTLVMVLAVSSYRKKVGLQTDFRSSNSLTKTASLVYLASICLILLFGAIIAVPSLFLVMQILALVMLNYYSSNRSNLYLVTQISLFVSSVYVTAFLLSKPSAQGGTLLLLFYASWTVKQLAVHYGSEHV